MKNFATVFLLFPVHLTLVASGSMAFNGTQQSCIPAHPFVNESLKNLNCKPYNYSKEGYCKDIIGNRDVHGSDQDEMEQNLQRFSIGKRMLEGYIPVKVRDSCFKIFNNSYCQYSFPKCDLTSALPLPTPVCRETCEDVFKVCDRELELVKGFNMRRWGDSKEGNDYPLYWKLVNCSTVQYRNGGDLPECYFSRHLNTETDKLIHTDCYYGNGLGYRGNVSVTRSGRVCQSWSSQCPHRHDHPLSEYPELVNASNWCRNPGGQGPDGPWCYTTNSSIRWEYCDVEKCPDPAPTLAPVIKEAYATGSRKLFISWHKVPLPFIHGQPRGFRIKISHLGQQLIVNTTSPNVTELDYKNLQPLTNYSLSVLAFNDAGDGPSSRPVYVKTMPKNSATVRFTLNLTRPSSRHAFLKRPFLKKRTQSFTFKIMILGLFKRRRQLDGYNIYQMKIIKFTNKTGQCVELQVKFDITAELTGRPSWSAVQDITGRILRHFNMTKKYSKSAQFNTLTIEAPPPPPANVTKSNVEKTSVTIEWSAPMYHEPYRITNYTVQHKKAGTDMRYYNTIVKSNVTKVTVNNLDAGKRYLMRVKSTNAHGSEASEPIEVETRKGDEKKEVLHIVLPLVAVLIVMIIFAVIYGVRKQKENKQMQIKLQKLRENPYESAVDWFAVLKIKITKQWWEIPRDDLLLDEELGSGAFGVVMKGYLTKREQGKTENRLICAVKMLKDNPTERELRDLCNEINFMSSVGDHPNLVSLIGACTTNGPLWLVVKFAPNGCLHDYLKENRPLPEYQNTCDLTPDQRRPKPISDRERMRFAYEIAQGMAHLERHRYVHRDLAARNVLLGKNMVAMVSDFGMSRDIYEIGIYENTAGGVLPVRWMALESLQDFTYTSKSDVWSYGVVLWEIESGGLMPYAGMSGLEVVDRLRQGYRLERPNNSLRDMYEIMWQCWNPDPNKRPTFADLVYKMGGLFNLSVDYENVDTVPNNNENILDGFKPEKDGKLKNKLRGQISFAELKEIDFIEPDIEM